MGRRFMQVMQRSQDRSQRWVDRAEVKREERAKRSPSRREVRSSEGWRVGLTARPRGLPDPDAFLVTSLLGTASLVLELSLMAFFWSRHRFKFHRTWLVSVTILDQSGFDTSDSRRLVVASRSAAVTMLSDVADLVSTGGVAGLDARIAAGALEAGDGSRSQGSEPNGGGSGERRPERPLG